MSWHFNVVIRLVEDVHEDAVYVEVDGKQVDTFYTKASAGDVKSILENIFNALNIDIDIEVKE